MKPMSVVLATALAVFSAASSAACYQVNGRIVSVSDPTCGITGFLGALPPGGNEFFLINPLNPGSSCFTLAGFTNPGPPGPLPSLQGAITGFSALTSTEVFGLSPSGRGQPSAPSRTPLQFEKPSGSPPAADEGPSVRAGAGLVGFTSRAALTATGDGLTVVNPDGSPGPTLAGTVFSRDTGYITNGGFLGQVLLVEGGTGDFEFATGQVAVAGQEFLGVVVPPPLPEQVPFIPSAHFEGSICIPPHE